MASFKTRSSSRATIGLSLLLGACAAHPADPGATGSRAQANNNDTPVITIGPPGLNLFVPPLLGVNKAPLFSPSAGVTYDVAELYKAIGITSVRTHDGPFDPCKVYLGSKVQRNGVSVTSCTPATTAADTVSWTADTATYPTASASSYTWSAVDPSATAIANAGAKAYVRLGESWSGVNSVTGAAQTDYAAVAAQMVSRIASKVPIEQAEIWNEPEELTSRFWKGTRSEFYDLYSKLAQTAALPFGLAAGGAGFASGVIYSWTDAIVANWVTDADPAGSASLSGHHYNDCTTANEQKLVDWLDTVRSNMTTDGLSSRPLHVTEWNIATVSGGDNCNVFGQAAHGSYVAAALLLMSQEEFKLKRSHFYPGVGNGTSALFSPSSNNVAISPAAWGFWGYQAIASKLRVPTTQIWSTGSGSPADAARAGQRWFGQFARTSTGKWFLELINDQTTAMNVKVIVGAGAAGATMRQKSGLAASNVWAGSSSAHVVSSADATAAFTVAGSAAAWSYTGSSSEMTLSLPANSITTLEW